MADATCDLCSNSHACLVCQKTRGDHKCPKCQGNRETVQLPVLVASKSERGKELCKKHDFPFVYWCNSKIELYCKKCVTEQEYVKLELVEDAIPSIKTVIIEKVDDFFNFVDWGVPFLDERHLVLEKCLYGVQSFMKDLQKLEKDLYESIAEIESLKAESLKGIFRATEIRAMAADVEAGTDMAVVLESRAEVEDLPQDYFLRDFPNRSLCNIVSSYLDVKELEGRDVRYSFLSKFIKVSGISKLSLRAALTFSESLEDDAEWCAVDEISRLGVLLALSDGKPKPSCLTFRKRQGLHYPSNVVAEAARNGNDCEFKAEFLDSFLHMRHTDIDHERLKSLIANSSLRLVTFVGYLDPASIAKLPPTIRTLGLAIKTAAEAAAVSSLHPWELLDTLHICVGEDISVDDLRPLPRVHTKVLHFSFKDVDRMRLALIALIPAQQEQYGCVQLYLSTSEVVIEEALRLAEQLRGSRINKGIIVESCTGELTETQRQKLVTAFREAGTGCITMESCTGKLTKTQRLRFVAAFRKVVTGGITIESCAGELTSTQRQQLVTAFREAVAAGGPPLDGSSDPSFPTVESCAEKLTSTQLHKLVRAFREAVTGGITFGSCVGELTETQRQKLCTEFGDVVASDITWTLAKKSFPSPGLESLFN